MVDEAQEVMKQFKGSASLDAGLLASAQTAGTTTFPGMER
jgi:ferritin-like metal-binding protein YciE